MRNSHAITNTQCMYVCMYVCILSLSFVLLPINAAAQDRIEAEVDEIEELIITGSNIRRKRDYDLASPIQTLDEVAVTGAGAGQVQDLLRTLPVNAGSELSTSQSQRQGVSQFSLRGLGVGGTLTLINGRRAGISPVASDDGAFFTDINQYPVKMIGSVEVLTDGASATYGSEAVSGVVNLITRQVQGAEFGFEIRESINSVTQLNAAFGDSSEKGSFSVFINTYEQTGNFRSEFDFIQARSNNGGDGLDRATLFDSSTGAGAYELATETSPGSGVWSNATTNYVADPHCAGSGPGNFQAAYTRGSGDNRVNIGTNCFYNFIDQRRLIPEESRLQVFGQGSYDLSDNAEFFAEFSFSTNEIRDGIGGAVLRTATQGGVQIDSADETMETGRGHLIPANHPFNYFISDGSGGITWNEAAVMADPSMAVPVISVHRPLTSYWDGARADDIVRTFDNSRLLYGINADLSEKWNLSASVMSAHTKFTDIQPRSFNAQAYANAIISHTWNPFGIANAMPDAVSVKDGTSTAGNDPVDILRFAAHRTFTADITQDVTEVIFSGDIFEYIDGRTIAVAFGFQQRNISYDDIVDSLSYFRLDGRADQVITISDASQSTTALFGEAILPLSSKVELQAALRFEDYGDSGGGDTFDPKLGVRWQLADRFLLRGSFGTSFQAPSIRNVFGAVGSGTLDDDVQGLIAGAACSSGTNDAPNAAQITRGADLSPQSAFNYNLGVVFGNATSPFDASIDYWFYDYTDLIQTGESFQSILDGECDENVYVPDDRVVRDAAGQLNSVTTSFINVGSVQATGLDLGFNYDLDLVNSNLSIFGRSTIILGFDIMQSAGGAAFDGSGNRNRFIGFGAIPDQRFNFGVRWSNPVHSFEVNYRLIGEYSDNTPSDDERETIASQTVIDVQYDLSLGENISLTFGITNLTDEEPPAVQDRIAYDYEVHDPRGQITYSRFKYKF